MQHPYFLDDDGSFALDRPEEISQLYFPLASEAGLKSCVSPDLGGDAKLDQETFLLEPVSVENLHNNRATRNFWLADGAGRAFSLTGASAAQQAARFTPGQEDSRLTAGLMWHTLDRTPAPGDYLLSDREIADLRALDETGLPLVLLLNAGGPVELTGLLAERRHPLAVVQLSQLGQQGGEAVADVLLGRAVPQGKLTATWPPGNPRP